MEWDVLKGNDNNRKFYWEAAAATVSSIMNLEKDSFKSSGNLQKLKINK